MLSLRLVGTEIVYGRKIKRLWVSKDAMFVRQKVKVVNGFGVDTVVVDDNDFVRMVTGFLFDADHALLE